MRRMVLISLMGCSLAVSASAAGATPGRVFNADKTWQTLTFADGCKAVVSAATDLEANWGPYAGTTWRWSGACGKDGLITGQGVLTTEFTSPANADGPATRYRMEKTAVAQSGILEGRSSELTYSNADDFDDKTPAGSMQVHDFGDARNPMPSFYKGGCSYYVNENGQPEMAEPTFNCDAAKGMALRDSLRGGKSAEPVGQTADAVAEALSAAAEATGKAECAQTPDETLARYNAEVKALTTRYPLKAGEGPPGSGAKAVNQWTAFVGAEGLKILEPYRTCLGPHYAANKSQLETMRDTGLANCAKLSTTGQCTADYPY